MLKQTAAGKSFFDDFVARNFIPPDHKLVKIKEFLNLDFLEPLVKDAYNNENNLGRTPIDPKVLFMSCLLESLEKLSDVEVARKIFEIPGYRYFVGLSLEDKAPDDTTISFFRLNRMGEEKFKAAFQRIIKQLQEAGLIDGQIQSQDATDVRADIALINVFQLINKGRLNLLKAIQKVNQKKYDKLLAKSNVEIQRNPANKQKHFEELITAAGLVYDAVRRGAGSVQGNARSNLDWN
ncbi:MAG: transposase [Candidatus Margulisiibacteriota bacterium]